jgi:hypothetical protein
MNILLKWLLIWFVFMTMKNGKLKIEKDNNCQLSIVNYQLNKKGGAQ